MQVRHSRGKVVSTWKFLSRTREQREAVKKIVHSPAFAYGVTCEGDGNYFSAKVGDYKGPFTFLWYDTSKRLHGTRISSKAKSIKDYATGVPLA